MPSRAKLYMVAQDSNGTKLSGRTVTVLEEDGTTPLAQSLYATATSAVALGNTLTSDSSGRIIAYADTMQDVVVVADGVSWAVPMEREADDQRTIDGYADFYADLYSRTADVSHWECIQRAIDAAAAYYVSTGLKAKVWLSAKTYTVHRSIRMRGMSGVWLLGYGMDLTTLTSTTNINGGDDGVSGGDPEQSDLIDAANGALALASYYTDLTWSDMTLDGSNMSLENLSHAWQEVGKASALIEAQNVHRPRAMRIRCVNGNANGIVFGNSTPNFANAFEDGRIEECEFVNTPRGLGLHYKAIIGGGHAPYGIAAQMGVVNGGRVSGNRFTDPNGPAYAVVGSKGLVFEKNYVNGYGGVVAALNGSAGGVHVDFGANDCVFDSNVANEGGPWVVNGLMTPSIYNGSTSTPGAKGSTWSNNKATGTARAAFPAPPTLTNGAYHLNNSGQDAFLILSGSVTFTSIRIGLRDDQSLAVGTRQLIVPNGWRVYLAWSSGTPTAAWWLARTANGSAPAFPSSAGTAANATGLPQIATIYPTVTSDQGAIPIASLPLTTSFSATIGAVERPRTGQRLNQVAIGVGETATLTYNNATVAAALETAYNTWGYTNLVVTGYTWTWHNTVEWTAQPTVPNSGLGNLVYNPLGVPVMVDVLTGTFTGIEIQDRDGAVTQTVQVTSADSGRKQFTIDPGGAFGGTWVTTRPTWTWYAAPNALLPQFYISSGSAVGYQGNIEDCRFIGNTTRLTPYGGLTLVDGLRCTFENDFVNISESRPGISYAFYDSGIAGGGTQDCVISGGNLVDSRGTPATASHYADNGANNTGNRLGGANLSATSSTTINVSTPARLAVDRLRGAGAAVYADRFSGAIGGPDLSTGRVLLATQTGTGASGVLTFSSIPAGYTDLELVIYGRSTTAATSASVRLSVNGDAVAANYYYQYVSATDTTPASAQNAGASAFILAGFVPAASGVLSTHYGASRVQVSEYAGTTGTKPIKASLAGGYDHASGGMLAFECSGSWGSTAAIATLALTLSAGNWTTGSVARLYGVR